MTAKPSWERNLRFRCTGCGNCCRDTVIPVNDEEVRRLQHGTGRRVTEIVQFVGRDRIAIDRSHPYWVRLAAGRRMMALRWRRGGACAFLTRDNQCTVYDHRPVVCHQHPFDVTFSETGAIERVAISRLVPCPHEWDGHTTRRRLLALDRQYERERSPYAEKIEAWHERRDGRRSEREFLRFLGFTL